MTHRIEKDQIYYSLDSREEKYGNGVRRIKVVGEPGTVPGGGQPFGKVAVVTLTEDGRETRKRLISVDQLHAGPIGRNGRKLTTGYAQES